MGRWSDPFGGAWWQSQPDLIACRRRPHVVVKGSLDKEERARILSIGVRWALEEVCKGGKFIAPQKFKRREPSVRMRAWVVRMVKVRVRVLDSDKLNNRVRYVRYGPAEIGLLLARLFDNPGVDVNGYDHVIGLGE